VAAERCFVFVRAGRHWFVFYSVADETVSAGVLPDLG
jgi:hypothetical protein